MLQNHKKTVTLKDIAADTGFSITTVSHALRNMSDISEATKQIVRERAQALGYIGNASASSLRSGVSNTIAVLLGDLSNPHFAFMAREIEQLLKQYGYSAFFMNTNEDAQMEHHAIRLALTQQVDGIILCPAQNNGSSENVRFIQSTHTPCVLIGRHFQDISVSFVACDDHKGGMVSGRHMLQNGHRHILYVDVAAQTSSTTERREGFLQALQESADPVRFSIVHFDERGDYLQPLFAGNTPSYTAVIAFNDIIAWDILCRLQDRGLRVPEDISLSGFDNLHSCLPLPFPLTSVSSSKITMPRRAVELLMAQIQDPQVPVSRLTLDVELIDRKSVKQL